MSLLSVEPPVGAATAISFSDALIILDRHIKELTELRNNPEVNEVPIASSTNTGPMVPAGPDQSLVEESTIDLSTIANGRRQLAGQSSNYAERFKSWMNDSANGTEAERAARFNERYVPRIRRVEKELRVVGMNLNGRVRLADGQAQKTLGTAGNFSAVNPVASGVFFEDKIVKVTTQVDEAEQTLFFQTYLIRRNAATAYHGYQIEAPGNMAGVVSATFQDRHRFAHILRTTNGRNFLVTSKTDLGVDFETGL